jgi:6-phospho-3-hexuloisomerase
MSGEAIARNLKRISEELSSCLGRTEPDELERLVEVVEAARRVFVGGAGRSGLAMRGFAMRLAHMGRDAYVVGETVNRSYGPDDLVVIGSGSGSTEGMVAIARKARAIGGRVALLTIDPRSKIAEVSDIVVRILAPSPKAPKAPKALAGEAGASCQPMGSLFEQSLGVLLDTVVLTLMQRSRKSSEEMFGEHATLE